MDLILWRHAEAREPEGGEDDLERPLTPKGERQAQRMAQWLDRQLPDAARVLASPALRTRQTAQALPRKLELAEALAPGHGVAELLQAAHWPSAKGPVVVVGHQPTLGLAAAYLLSGSTQAWAVRKGGIWWLRRRSRAGREEVVLEAVMSPEQL